MSDTTECEFFLIVDADGGFVLAQEESDADDLANEELIQPRQTIRITLAVPLPKVIEVEASMPKSESGEYSLEIKQTA